MARIFKFTFVSFRDLAVTIGPALLAVVAILWGAYVYIDPTPPKHVTMSTGTADSGYNNYARKYQAFLAQDGITLDLKTSEGSLENLNRLDDDNSDVQVAFVQSGITDESSSESEGLVSLGSLFVEPVWIFYRDGLHIRNLSDLVGKRVNIGTEGSGFPRLATKLFAANHITQAQMHIEHLESDPAASELLGGTLDVVMISSSPNTPAIQKLLRAKGIRLFNFSQAEAYTRLFPFLKHVVLPRGIVSFDENIPAREIDLIAPTATLVATDLTHPAILELLVQAAAKEHGGAGWFRRAGEYPNPANSEIPVAKVAERYYKYGAPFLQRYMPFWLANLVERMWIVLISLLALILPLARVIPPVYTWRVRSRVYRWYGQLRIVEFEYEEAARQHDGMDPQVYKSTLSEMIGRLDAIEAKVNRLSVPLSYAEELYSLRSHIEMVRERIRLGSSPETV